MPSSRRRRHHRPTTTRSIPRERASSARACSAAAGQQRGADSPTLLRRSTSERSRSFGPTPTHTWRPRVRVRPGSCLVSACVSACAQQLVLLLLLVGMRRQVVPSCCCTAAKSHDVRASGQRWRSLAGCGQRPARQTQAAALQLKLRSATGRKTGGGGASARRERAECLGACEARKNPKRVGASVSRSFRARSATRLQHAQAARHRRLGQ